MNKLTKQLIVLFLVFIVLAALLSNVNSPFGGETPEEVPFNELVALIEEEHITTIAVNPEGTIDATLTDGTEIKTQMLAGDSLISTLKDYELPTEKLRNITIEQTRQSGLSGALSFLLPVLLPFLLLGGLLYFMYRGAQGMNSKAMSFGAGVGKQANLQGEDGKKDGKPKTTFKDVAGAHEAKEELIEIIDFLKHPKKFTDLGARIPSGVLLVGPPGTGKTMLAKAVAGEAEVPFFHISGSEFMELFVGVGASRVRALFQKAKRSAPSIIFIDELDSIGRKRGGGFGGAHDERDQTLNQILVEMDGFETDTNVIVMAATNRPDVLDSALLRPGRFDRRVVLDLPDIKSREEIIHVHSKGKPLAKTVNLRRVAERTPGFSGADLSNLMNEAAILTARENKKELTMEIIILSIEKVLLGPERKSRVISDKEKEITAYHEAGHGVVAHILPNTDPVHKISIISRGQAGGYTLKVPEKDKYLITRSEFIDDLAVAMGGLAAEKYKYNEMTTGASGDLAHASKLARKIVTNYGMSDKIGPVSFNGEEPDFATGFPLMQEPQHSDQTLQRIDEEVADLLKKAYNKAEETIASHKEKLELVAKELLEKETIEKEAFEDLMQKVH